MTGEGGVELGLGVIPGSPPFHSYKGYYPSAFHFQRAHPWGSEGLTLINWLRTLKHLRGKSRSLGPLSTTEDLAKSFNPKQPPSTPSFPTRRCRSRDQGQAEVIGSTPPFVLNCHCCHWAGPGSFQLSPSSQRREGQGPGHSLPASYLILSSSNWA